MLWGYGGIEGNAQQCGYPLWAMDVSVVQRTSQDGQVGQGYQQSGSGGNYWLVGSGGLEIPVPGSVGLD